MKIATLNITTPYKVTVIPTQMRFSLKRDLFEQDGAKLCEIQYEILAGKYIQMVPKLDDNGQPVLKSGKPVLEENIVDFTSPVIYHTDSKVIPFELYLLIEAYRANNLASSLELINQALQGFNFEGSLANFKLAVTNVQ
ncbi:hypothetical protein [Flectobacillus major]|jgi:hypothetical protein|uniref:hypothetical protein n=1 Tax=Flectobacillus major TaxID=103 RepID=UPI0003F9D3AA|nr:hypothetical protein [Flectobacillus major]